MVSTKPEQPSFRAVDNSYHPKGFGESASLKRARAPYQIRNWVTGGAIVAFIAGVYLYSISAVKQDDFSDVVDLLPPEAERKNIRSIEDEERDRKLGVQPPSTSNDAAALAAPGSRAPATSTTLKTTTATAPAAASTGVVSFLPRRLNEIEWVQQRGWVEPGKGNVLVWGAPTVDNVGKMREASSASSTARGAKRQV